MMDWLLHQLPVWLSFSAKQPIIFTEIGFWVFFAIVLAVYQLVHRKMAMRNAFLFLVSLYFYYKTSGGFFLLLLFSTTVDYYVGAWLYRSQTEWKRKAWVAVSVVTNLSVLFYFKYPYFFAQFLADGFGLLWEPVPHYALWSNAYLGTDFVEDRILLPVGISFYTFQCMSYTIDIYRRQIEPVRRILDFGFYVSFFPQLVAGPIVRASEFIPQLYKKYELSKAAFGLAFFWILNGLLKKLILADYIASNFADRVFAQPTLYSGLECLLALFAYSLQVYADFSGYTDVAIGVAMLMGFTLTKNFNSPYKALSVSDFWRRWHISLSTWLRDYLYIPLGGNRQGSFASYTIVFLALFVISMMAESFLVPVSLAGVILFIFLLSRFWVPFRRWLNTNINVMLTMLLGGFWHGSSWNFVTWGGLNGLGLVIYKLWAKIRPWSPRNSWVGKAFGLASTLLFITLTRAWFRAPGWDEALSILTRTWTAMDLNIAGDILIGFWRPLSVMVLGYLIHWIPSRWKNRYRELFAQAPLGWQLVVAFLAVVTIYQSLSADSQPFIYFQF
jgi:alginate O-acetyltransferase complex protein AlgI